MYKFIKVKLPATDTMKEMVYKEWFFMAKDFLDIFHIHEKIYPTLLEEAVHDIVEDRKMKRHFRTHLGNAVSTLAKLNETSPLVTELPNLVSKIRNGQYKILADYGHVLIRESGSYMALTSNYEITEEVVKETLSFPERSLTDIRIIQWPNGTHYYAKIGNEDVVDEDGNQKWNTHDEAYEKAIEYFNLNFK